VPTKLTGWRREPGRCGGRSRFAVDISAAGREDHDGVSPPRPPQGRVGFSPSTAASTPSTWRSSSPSWPRARARPPANTEGVVQQGATELLHPAVWGACEKGLLTKWPGNGRESRHLAGHGAKDGGGTRVLEPDSGAEGVSFTESSPPSGQRATPLRRMARMRRGGFGGWSCSAEDSAIHSRKR